MFPQHLLSRSLSVWARVNSRSLHFPFFLFLILSLPSIPSFDIFSIVNLHIADSASAISQLYPLLRSKFQVNCQKSQRWVILLLRNLEISFFKVIFSHLCPCFHRFLCSFPSFLFLMYSISSSVYQNCYQSSKNKLLFKDEHLHLKNLITQLISKLLPIIVQNA